MDSYAVVDGTGLITNIIEWDGESEWTPPEGNTSVLCGNDTECIIGGFYQNGAFTPPPKPEIPKEESIAEADQTKTSLLAEATLMIDPLQDAVDLDMATDDEIAELNAWKKYRVLVSRVDTSLAPDVTWPEKPQK